MILRLSDTLARKLRARPVALHPLNVNPFADWTAHVTRADRTSLLVILNTRSLYTVVAPLEGIVTIQSMEARLFAYVKARLLDDGFEFLFRRLIDQDNEKTTFSKPLNAQSIGALEDVTELLQHYLTEAGLDADEAARKINEMPFSILGQLCPREAFKAMTF